MEPIEKEGMRAEFIEGGSDKLRQRIELIHRTLIHLIRQMEKALKSQSRLGRLVEKMFGQTWSKQLKVTVAQDDYVLKLQINGGSLSYRFILKTDRSREEAYGNNLSGHHSWSEELACALYQRLDWVVEAVEKRWLSASQIRLNNSLEQIGREVSF